MVAVQVATVGIDAALATQFEPAPIEPSPAPALLMIWLVGALALPGSQARRAARVGRMALRASPRVSEEQRLEVIRARIGDVGWPDGDIRITAVNAVSGRLAVFDRTSGVDLVDAVASCAVPIVTPPVTIGHPGSRGARCDRTQPDRSRQTGRCRPRRRAAGR